MASFVVVLSWLVLQDGELVRFGGEAAVPSPDASAEAPLEVAPRPVKADAVYRTRAGAWRFYDGAKDRVVELPIVGERLVGWSANGGSLLTSLASGRVLRWRAGTWTQLAELVATHAPEVTAISPDGHHVLVAGPSPEGRGQRYTLFGGTVGLALQRIDREAAHARAPVALSDERAALWVGEAIEIYTLPRLEPERVVPVDGAVRALAFADEGGAVLALGGDDEDLTVTRFAVADGKRLGVVSLPRGCTRGALADNGAVAACVLMKPTRAAIIDLPAGTIRATVPAPAGQDPVLDPAGTRVAFAGNRAVPVWDATIDGVLPAAARAGVVTALACAGDGRVAALEASGVARVWDPGSGTETLRVPKPAAAIATWPQSGTLVVAGSPLTALAEATGEARWSVKGSRPVAVAAAPDGRVFWIERNGDLRVRAPEGKVRRLARALRGERPSVGQVPRLLLAPSGAEILFGARVLDAANGKARREVPPGLAAWAGGAVVVATAATPDAPERLAAGPIVFEGAGAVTALTGDGALVAAGDRDGVVHVWSASGERVLQRGVHRGPVVALVLDAARRRVYSAGSDGVILGATWEERR